MKTCLLELSPRFEECSEDKCTRCVWRTDNFEKRQRLLKKQGLTQCDDGLKRLIIPRERRGWE